MNDEIVTTLGDRMRIAVGENLIKAQERLANSGTARENILLARFLLQTSKKFDNVIQKICAEEGERNSQKPPDKGQKHITNFKRDVEDVIAALRKNNIEYSQGNRPDC